MKLFRILIAALVLPISCRSRVDNAKSSSSSALNVLNRLEPDVKWEPRTLLKADFDFDGVEDYSLGARKGTQYVVGIVMGPLNGQSKHWTLEFSEDAGDQGSLCSVSDAQIRLDMLDDELVVGARGLPEMSKGINLYDDKCDSFHIYWDQKEKRFEWWRH
jgi:hypothetical protein